MTTEPAKIHTFAHLGAYPYRYLGYEHKAYSAAPGVPGAPATIAERRSTTSTRSSAPTGSGFTSAPHASKRPATRA